MSIDIRERWTCSLGPLISASLSYDYAQENGLIKLTGTCVINGVISPSAGDPVTFTPTGVPSNPITSDIPKSVLVISSFADPIRKTTTVQLGCKLTLLSDVKEETRVSGLELPGANDFEQEDEAIVVIPIRAMDIVQVCTEKLGITGFAPLTNSFSIKEFDFSNGYVNILSDLLISENKIGYMTNQASLEVKDLNLLSEGSGRVLFEKDVIDIGPVGIGQQPADTIAVSYSTRKLKNPDGEEDALKRSWEFDETYGEPSEVELEGEYYQTSFGSAGPWGPYLYTYTPYSSSRSFYDSWDRLTTRITIEKSIAAEVNPEYVKQHISYFRNWTIGQTEIYKITVTDITYKKYPGTGGTITRPNESTLQETPELEDGYDEVEQEVTTTYESQLSSLSAIARNYYDEQDKFFFQLDYGEAVNALAINTGVFVPPDSYLITQQTIVAAETYSRYMTVKTEAGTAEIGNFPITKTKTKRYKIFGQTPKGQRYVEAKLEEGIKIYELLETIERLVYSGTEVQAVSGRESVFQGRPNSADRALSDLSDGGDPNNGYSVESVSGLEMLGSENSTGRILDLSMPYAPDDAFIKTGDTFIAVPSDAPKKARDFGETQNRLLLGTQAGVSLQTGPGIIDAKPLAGVILSLSGISGLFLANGTTWTINGNGLIVSSDFITMGTIGADSSADSSWIPLPPGMTVDDLPETPEIIDTSPSEIIGTINGVGEDPQESLNELFPNAIDENGVIDTLTSNVWISIGSVWYNFGTTPGPTLTYNSVIPLYKTTYQLNAATKTKIQVKTFTYALQLLKDLVGSTKTLLEAGIATVVRLTESVNSIIYSHLPSIETDAPAPEFSIANITYTQSSLYQDNQNASNASMTDGVFNGSAATSTDYGEPSWVKMNLQGDFDVDRVVIGAADIGSMSGGWSYNDLSGCIAQSSTDDSSWTDLFTIDFNNFPHGGIYEFTLPEFTSRFIRLISEAGYVPISEFYALPTFEDPYPGTFGQVMATTGTAAPVLGATQVSQAAASAAGWTQIFQQISDTRMLCLLTEFQFPFYLNNRAYSSCYIYGNGYITFGVPKSITSSYSQSNPNVPKLYFGGRSLSFQRVYIKSEQTAYRIRVEGNSSLTVDVNTSNRFIEITIYKATQEGIQYIEVRSGSIGGSLSGPFMIATATTSLASGTLAQNQSWVYTGNSTGTSWTLQTSANVQVDTSTKILAPSTSVTVLFNVISVDAQSAISVPLAQVQISSAAPALSSGASLIIDNANISANAGQPSVLAGGILVPVRVVSLSASSGAISIGALALIPLTNITTSSLSPIDIGYQPVIKVASANIEIDAHEPFVSVEIAINTDAVEVACSTDAPFISAGTSMDISESTIEVNVFVPSVQATSGEEYMESMIGIYDYMPNWPLDLSE